MKIESSARIPAIATMPYIILSRLGIIDKIRAVSLTRSTLRNATRPQLIAPIALNNIDMSVMIFIIDWSFLIKYRKNSRLVACKINLTIILFAIFV